MAEARMSKARARHGHDYRLAVDVGNTQTVLGLFDGDRISKRWRMATRKDVTIDEIVLWLRGLVSPKTGNAPVRPVLASVVPVQDGPWRAALTEVFGGPARTAPRVLNHRDCGGLALDYEIPSQIGADRLANVLGARALGIAEGVVIDFGTATTFDVFTRNTYHGGIICPGLQSGMHALAQNAARLAEAELRWPEAATGRTTDEALRSGILRGAVGMVKHLLKEVLAERPMRKPTVIATGGLAHWLQNRTSSIDRFEPDLTLIGINHLFASPVTASANLKKVPATPSRAPTKKTSTARPSRKRPS